MAPSPAKEGSGCQCCHPGLEPRAARWQCLGETDVRYWKEAQGSQEACFKLGLQGHSQWE